MPEGGVNRWMLYVLISLLIVAAIVLLAFSIQGSINSAVHNWIRLTMFTAVVFGTLLKWAWKYRWHAKFWLLYISFAVVHCALFIPLFSKERWPTLAMGLLASVEVMVLVGTTLWLMHSKREKHAHRDRDLT